MENGAVAIAHMMMSSVIGGNIELCENELRNAERVRC